MLTRELRRRWFWFKRRHRTAIWLVGLVFACNAFALSLFIAHDLGWIE